MSTITFTSDIQKFIFEIELCGQLSDGYWENSRPSNHWRTPCNADVIVGEEAGVDFHPDINYNFCNKNLLECVGDRMIMYTRAHIKFPQLSNGAVNLLDSGDWVFDQTGASYVEILNEWSSIGITDTASKIAVLNEISLVDYQLKHLMKDLRSISAAFKTYKS